MANFDTIKTAIDANIKTNGTQDITGGKMNSILKQIVDATDEQLTELESNQTLYKVSTNDVINSYIRELYLTGLSQNKRYVVRRLQTYNNSGVIRKTMVIYVEDGGLQPVAQMDTILSNKNVASVFALNNSGITGYVVDNITEGTDIYGNVNMDLNRAVVENLNNNPTIAAYIHNELYDAKVSEIEENYNTKSVSNSKAINNIIQEIYLTGTDASKEYEIRSMLVYSNRKTFVIAEVGGANVAQMDSPLSDTGVVSIFALNNSGITGYAVCNFPNELNIQPYKTLNKWVYTSLEQNANIAFYLREDKNIIQVPSIRQYGKGDGSKGGFNADFRVLANLVESELDGILTRIKMLANVAGVAFFGVGFVDQNKRAILKKIFSIPVVDGENNVDVTDLGIKIDKGDVLFGLPFYSGGDMSVFTFTNKTSETGNAARLYFATSVGGNLFSYHSIGGGEFSYANIEWEIKDLKSPFANKEKVEDLSAELNNVTSLANKALSNSFKVKDRQGNTYKMVVVDGSISLIPQQFKNVAVVGNSITLHGRSDAVNWLTSGYGMAASTPDTDFSAFILEACKSKDSTSVLTRKNLAHWETSLVLSDSIKAEVRELVSGKDLVIIKIGENVSSAATNFSTAFAELIDYIISVNANAEIVVCSLFWSDATKDKVMRDVAMSKNLVYCTGAMTDSEQMEAMGHYLKSTDGTFFEVNNYGVQRHPSDIGMLMIANSILTALDMGTLDKLHSINVVSNGADVECYTRGVAGGIVTISANLKPTIKTTSGLSIAATSVADGKWVFTMPNEDVTISVA